MKGHEGFNKCITAVQIHPCFFFVFATTLLESICLVYLGKKKKKKLKNSVIVNVKC